MAKILIRVFLVLLGIYIEFSMAHSISIGRFEGKWGQNYYRDKDPITFWGFYHRFNYCGDRSYL
jgi:hypothetical protein